MGDFRIRRLEPTHDPEAYERVVRILGIGLRRGLLRLRTGDPKGCESPSTEVFPWKVNAE